MDITPTPTTSKRKKVFWFLVICLAGWALGQLASGFAARVMVP
ncbi:hypothetical protein [Roseomonas sp. WA12]